MSKKIEIKQIKSGIGYKSNAKKNSYCIGIDKNE